MVEGKSVQVDRLSLGISYSRDPGGLRLWPQCQPRITLGESLLQALSPEHILLFARLVVILPNPAPPRKLVKPSLNPTAFTLQNVITVSFKTNPLQVRRNCSS